MTDQIDMIYLKFLYLNHLRRIKLSTVINLFSVDGFDVNRYIRKILNKSCRFDQSF